MSEENSTIPYGCCHCGCGEKTAVPKWDNQASGAIAGVPQHYLRGHNFKVKPAIRRRKREAPEGMHWCSSCDTMKELSGFYKHKGAKTGYSYECRVCIKKRVAKWQRDNPERQSAKQRRWAAANRGQVAAIRRRSSAIRRKRKKDYGGTVTTQEVNEMLVSQEYLCAYCEEPLGEDYELDHMAPLSRGGTSGWTNIAPACQWCNRSKGAQTVEEFFAS